MIQTRLYIISLPEKPKLISAFQVYDNITKLAINTPKSYGKSIKPSQLGEGIAKFFPVGAPVTDLSGADGKPASSCGLPRDTLIQVIRAIRNEIAEIKDIMASLELRMVGGSLLIIYEADWERAVKGLEKFGLDDSKAGSQVEYEDDSEDDEEEDVDYSEDGTTFKRIGPPFVVKLIDFAHTKLVPGQGSDMGVLTGMDTVLRLLDARLDEIFQL